jgi:hypothetical protein
MNFSNRREEMLMRRGDLSQPPILPPKPLVEYKRLQGFFAGEFFGRR